MCVQKDEAARQQTRARWRRQRPGSSRIYSAEAKPARRAIKRVGLICKGINQLNVTWFDPFPDKKYILHLPLSFEPIRKHLARSQRFLSYKEKEKSRPNVLPSGFASQSNILTTVEVGLGRLARVVALVVSGSVNAGSVGVGAGAAPARPVQSHQLTLDRLSFFLFSSQLHIQ